MNFAGMINFARVTDEGSRVRLEAQGIATLQKGLLEYPATPVWQTKWMVYDDFGKLLWQDSRQHSLMPLAVSDSAQDEINVTFPKSGSSYRIQLYAQLVEAPRLLDVKRAAIGEETQPGVIAPILPIPAPSPSPTIPYVPPDSGPYVPSAPAPAPLVPWLPKLPDLSSAKGWLFPVAIGLVSIILLAPKRKK